MSTVERAEEWRVRLLKEKENRERILDAVVRVYFEREYPELWARHGGVINLNSDFIDWIKGKHYRHIVDRFQARMLLYGLGQD